MKLPEPRVLGDDHRFHPGSVDGIRFLDGARVISWSRSEGGVRLWMREVTTSLGPLLPGIRMGPGAVALSPRGTRLAGAGSGEQLVLQAPGIGARLQVVPTPGHRLRCVCFLDEDRLCIGDDGGKVLLVDRREPENLREVPLPETRYLRGVESLAVHPRGRLLMVTRSGDGFRLLDLESGETLQEGTGVLRGGGFLDRGASAWVLSWRGELRLGVVEPGRRLRPVLVARALTADPSRRGLLAVTEDGELIPVGAEGPRESLPWRLEGAAGLTSMALSPDGRRLALGYGSGEIDLRELATGKILDPPPRLDAVRPLGFDEQGRLVAGVRGRRVARWDLVEDEPGPEPEGPLLPLASGGVAASGGRVAVLDGLGQLTLAGWDGAAPRVLGEAPGHRWVRWSPDGARLATGGGRKSLSLWSPEGEVAPRTLSIGRDSRLAAWSPDSRVLVLAGRRKKVRFLQVESLRILGSHPSAVHPLGAVAWHPDGRHLFLLGENGGLEVRDLVARVTTVVLEDLPGGNHMAVSPDARFLAYGGWRQLLLLELERTGAGLRPRERVRIENLRGAVEGVAFSPDGRRLAVSDRTRLVRVWDLG